MVRDNEVVTIESYRKPPSLYRLVPLVTHTTISSPKLESQMHSRNQLRDVRCHLANMIKDINKISFAYGSPIERCHLLPLALVFHWHTGGLFFSLV